MNSYKDELLTVEDSTPLDGVPATGPGRLLKRKREEMGLSHEQIAQTTKIRPHILQALEEEDWDALPSSAFVKGFLRSYARSLGLDESIVADAYLEVSKDKEILPETAPKPVRRRKGKVLYIFSAVILLSGLFFLFTYGEKIWNSRSSKGSNTFPENSTRAPLKDAGESLGKKVSVSHGENTAPAAERDTSSIETAPESSLKLENAEPTIAQTEDSGGAPSSATEPILETGPLPVETADAIPAPASSEPSEGMLLLKATVQERTWIRVFVDDREPKDYVFQPGSTPEWTAEKGFELLIGNAGGVQLGLEGTDMKTFGKKGQVVRLNIPEGYERRNRNN